MKPKQKQSPKKAPPKKVVRKSAAKKSPADFTPDIERMKVADLIPYVNNAKRHTPEQVTMLAASIKEFGFIIPVVVDAEGVIVAGHGRVAAAEKLGMDSVPTVKAAHLTPLQVKAYRIADNRLASLTGLDPELMRLELEAIQVDFKDFDFAAMGFDAEGLKAILEEGNPDDFFKDKEGEGGGKKKKTVKCPKCGEEFEI